ncbi:acyltransferase [Thermaurantimonas aggregans]|uniref:Acyltransferase n=2 Tax=Thermaurantimonas aggregans TaxID=2173829 RepID=A0A401XLS5_9FLAO|nr:acyltransferase [Thermaurantimonas aggregans]
MFVEGLGINASSVKSVEQIPFLPIEMFKKFRILTENNTYQTIFRSSTTTGSVPSSHYIADLDWYEKSLTAGFRLFYGEPEEFCILGLLPSYLERQDSSLVYMVNHLMKLSAHPLNGFFLNEYEELVRRLKILHRENQKTLLVGVTFALLDLADSYTLELPSTILLETGGMKGRRREMIREEVHRILTDRLHPLRIDSEYGMTELLSQAYKIGSLPFATVPWMRVLARNINDPLGSFTYNNTGLLHVIDLANVYSCSFIATQDVGRVQPDGKFDVLGRYDHAEARGCNLMVNF